MAGDAGVSQGLPPRAPVALHALVVKTGHRLASVRQRALASLAFKAAHALRPPADMAAQPALVANALACLTAEDGAADSAVELLAALARVRGARRGAADHPVGRWPRVTVTSPAPSRALFPLQHPPSDIIASVAAASARYCSRTL